MIMQQMEIPANDPQQTFICEECCEETTNESMTCDSCAALADEEDEETVEVPVSQRAAVLKLHIGKRPLHNGGGRYYSCYADMYVHGSGAGVETAEEVVKFFKSCLKDFHEHDGLILDEAHVKLENSTSINLSIGQLLSEKSGNLANFLGVKIKANVQLEFEKLTDDEIAGNKEYDERHIFEERVLDPLREELSKTEKICREFGLPERSGFDCWGFKEFKEACKNPKALKPFMDCVLAHIKFDMIQGHDESKIENFKPDKTDSVGVWTLQKYNYLKKVMK